MRWSLDRWRRACLIPVVVWTLAAVPAAPQEAPLGDLELPDSPIVINLDDARLAIVASDDPEPVVRWWRDQADAPGVAELSAFQDGGAVVLQRPELQEGETAARLRVEVAVGSGQAVAVTGGRLELGFLRSVTEAPELDGAGRPTETQPPAGLELQLIDSRVSIVSAGAVRASFENCDVELRDTGGNLEIEVRAGTVRLIGHRGAVNLRGDGADVTAEDSAGQLSFNLAGGSAALRSTQGRFKLELTDAHAQLLDAGGSGVLVAADSNADLRDCTFQSLNIKTSMSHLTIGGCRGTITIDLTGGSLAADDVTGDLTGIGREGARVELTEQRGNVNLNLQQDASADLRNTRGDVTVRASDSELTVDGMASLSVDLTRAWASLSRIWKLAGFKATSSEVDLDLSTTRSPSVEVGIQADSVVRVHLATPCRVKATGLDESLASQVDVTGCELQLGRGGRWATRRVRGIDGQPPVTLTAKVAESAELVVEGRP